MARALHWLTVLLCCAAVAQSRKDMVTLRLDVDNGKVRTVYHHRDKTSEYTARKALEVYRLGIEYEEIILDKLRGHRTLMGVCFPTKSALYRYDTHTRAQVCGGRGVGGVGGRVSVRPPPAPPFSCGTALRV
jgi:hypothetical protein